MNEQAFEQATGRSRSEWFEIIRSSGKTDPSHKEIADYLHDAHGVSSWWAQEITVEYEKHIGRRVLGQTQDGLFQIGVSKTIPAPAGKVWNLLKSAEGINLITSNPEVDPPPGGAGSAPGTPAALDALEEQSTTGIQATTTTFTAGSHVRMRWQLPGWPTYSILQIRVTPKSETRTTLAFHQEKLPSREARDKMQTHWRRISQRMAEILATGHSAGG
jgi:uncharacterized protein YndB with AHSA1/START domain